MDPPSRVPPVPGDPCAVRAAPTGAGREGAYLRRVALGTALLVAGVAAFNLLADPYEVFRLAAVPRLNAHKPYARFHDRLHKAWAVRHARPDVVLLGTSRTQIGLPAAALREQRWAERPLNLGLPGGTVYEAYRYLQHADAAGEVRRAVVGLDLLMFNGLSARANQEFAEHRLLVAASGSPHRASWAADLAPTLLSLDALADGLRTVRRQAWGGYVLDDGTRNPAVQERSAAAAGGARAAMLSAERTYFEWMRCFRLPQPPDDPPHLEDLARLLGFARERGIEVELLVSPSHARHAELVRLSGQWEAQARWKRELVRVVEESAARGPGGTARAPRLWDFSRAEGPTVEEVPAAAERASRMRWYWDSAHFTPALGEQVLARLAGKAGAPAGFGVLLDSASLDEQLYLSEAAQAQWASTHPADVAELEALQREVAAKAAGGGCQRGEDQGEARVAGL